MYFNMLVIFVYVDYIIVWFNVKLFLILSSGVYGFWYVYKSDKFLYSSNLCFVFCIFIISVCYCLM